MVKLELIMRVKKGARLCVNRFRNEEQIQDRIEGAAIGASRCVKEASAPCRTAWDIKGRIRATCTQSHNPLVNLSMIFEEDMQSSSTSRIDHKRIYVLAEGERKREQD
jgi:hypothetical protein